MSVLNAKKNLKEPNVRKSVLNAIENVQNVKRNRIGLNERRKGKAILSLKGLDLRKKSKFSVYVQSMNLRWQK